VDGKEARVEEININEFNLCPIMCLVWVVGSKIIGNCKGKVYLKTK